MKISLRWLNRYLDPGDATAAEVDRALTFAAFTVDSHTAIRGGETAADGDVLLDVEVTSNRGDCLSHVGIAREVAASTGRRLVAPACVEPAGAGGAAALALENLVPGACPLFTARVIEGVRVGPSPAWMVSLLESVGQRSINNVVDATNFGTFELGQPSHVFDLAKLRGARLVIRWAREGEGLTTLDGKKRVLRADELVVADAERAQSLAGVIGGGESEVTAGTTRVVLEAATWDPAVVRRASRRHQVRTDASHRFERVVDPGTVDEAARRIASLILEVAGGRVVGAPLRAGAAAKPAACVTLRPARCRALTGMALSRAEMGERLQRLGFGVGDGTAGAGEDRELVATVPAFRPDVRREVDLIEEIARTKGLEHVAVRETVTVRVSPPQESERAAREVGTALAALGFYEAVTFSFVREEQARGFVEAGRGLLRVDDARRREDGTLRASLIPSLLECRRKNHAAQPGAGGRIRLYEAASVFWVGEGGAAEEEGRLGLVLDVPGAGKKRTAEELQAGLRLARGAVEAAVCAARGVGVGVSVRAAEPRVAGFERGAHGDVEVDGARIGCVGLVRAAELERYGLETAVAAAEVSLAALIGGVRRTARVAAPAAFPGVERDLSLVVDERVTWAETAALVESLRLPQLESCAFVGTYRGKQAGAGKKSLTLRLTFRDATRTLRHEEVDDRVKAVVAAAGAKLGAVLRA